MSPLGQKWTGPICVGIGFVMLAVQVYAYLDVGLLSSWLIGGGVGLLLAGAMMWFYYLDDKRLGTRISSDGEYPTAEEYERQFQEVDPDDMDVTR